MLSMCSGFAGGWYILSHLLRTVTVDLVLYVFAEFFWSKSVSKVCNKNFMRPQCIAMYVSPFFQMIFQLSMI